MLVVGREMITSVKKFGAYVLTRDHSLFDDDDIVGTGTQQLNNEGITTTSDNHQITAVRTSNSVSLIDNENINGTGSNIYSSQHNILPETFASTAITEHGWSSKCAIPPDWTDLTLIHIQKYNHDTSLFKFRLPEGKDKLRLPVGSFLLVKAPKCQRNPILADKDKSAFRYHASSHNKTCDSNANDREDEIPLFVDGIRPYTSVTDDDLEYDMNVAAATNPSSPFPSHPSTHRHMEQSSQVISVTGSFDLMCKRYDEWGKVESRQYNPLFTQTNHSYRPAGAVSTYIHNMQIGDTLKFKHNSKCKGRFTYPFETSQIDKEKKVENEILNDGEKETRESNNTHINFNAELSMHTLPPAPPISPILPTLTHLTHLPPTVAPHTHDPFLTSSNPDENNDINHVLMIAVGIGVAPMIHTIRHIIKDFESKRNYIKGNDQREEKDSDAPIIGDTTERKESAGSNNHEEDKFTIQSITLLYGVRTVADILLKEQLEAWVQQYGSGSAINEVNEGANNEVKSEVDPQFRFEVVYCIGSRYANVHMGYKAGASQYTPPPLPAGYSALTTHKELVRTPPF